MTKNVTQSKVATPASDSASTPSVKPESSPDCKSKPSIPSTLKVDLNTPTDFWVVGANALVGAAGILTAIVVAWITRRNQISQNKINLASLRQKWQERFAEAAAKYLGLANEIAVETVLKTSDHDERKEHATARLPDLLYWHEAILLMLDRENDYAKDARRTMNSITNGLRAFNLKDVGDNLKTLRQQFNEIHEKAWQDMQKDLSS